MRVVLLSLALLLALCCSFVAAESAVSIPAQTQHASPISTATIASDGTIVDAVANPLLPPQPPAVTLAPKPKKEYYRKPKDFLGSRVGVPMNPTRHLQRVLEEDKKYIAAILRSPLDIGDPAACKHSDIEKDKVALKKIALRINHRRVALKQQQTWIDGANEGLKRLQDEIKATTSTAQNLAEQLDALQQQREDVANHVRRAMLLKELDQTSANLMRLKNARMKQETGLQKKHNAFAVQNRKHNSVLKKLHKMRTTGKLPLGYLEDPKPYRFQQVENGAAAEGEAALDELAEEAHIAMLEAETQKDLAAREAQKLTAEQMDAKEAEANKL